MITKLTPKQYATALYQALSETDLRDHDKVLDNFVSVLRENQALGMVSAIEQEYLAYEREAKGITLAEVTSARPLASEEESKLIQELNNYVKGKVELRKQIDEGLIGGVMIKVGDELIDGSVRKSLDEFKQELIK